MIPITILSYEGAVRAFRCMRLWLHVALHFVSLGHLLQLTSYFVEEGWANQFPGQLSQTYKALLQ